MNRPLAGVRVVEFAGIGPAPFCGMMLADHGADVIRIDRKARDTGEPDFDQIYALGRFDVMGRGKRSIALNLKAEAGRAVARKLIGRADVVIEGFRPGVMEGLGLGPEEARAENPALVYARMTGWGQTGPLSPRAGHDNNYLGLSGALHMTGRKGAPPVAAPALLGDFGGGGMMLAFGIAAALLKARETGEGAVIDAAIVDGAGLFTAGFQGFCQAGVWRDETGANFLDTGADFYDTYECADGRHIAVGPIEPAFFKVLAEGLGLGPEWAEDRFDPARWPERKARLAAIFKTKTRDEWTAIFEASDACVSPVLSLAEAPDHPHAKARGAFVEVAGVTQPSPAPRFGSETTMPQPPPRAVGADTNAVLEEIGHDPAAIAALRKSGVVAG